ncbi:adenosylcobinamide-phosphate synthase CbiB [Planococcus sp. ISL-109]|uniref:adenosylcobinamide-phosphate synthase CbiB n=1 Tax=Planococcus sp. ISL-109 TaxID=2819166 RepID=UPI001BE6A470|nr:adenosylcobinamide-phosphate synthase CbiB [Planococcus sp. ISL-109]MBT2583030.1 cobalamin biosynthesis protein CobD [Planococcus sp. ISL-109]
MIYHVLAIGLGLVLDRLIGDPPTWPHPVRWIGSLINWLKRLNVPKYAFRNGFIMLAIVLITVVSITVGLVSGAYAVSPVIGVAVEAVLIAAGLSQKSLKQAAEDVYAPLVQKDFALAREKLSWIVGRDTNALGESEITRGVVETVSENTSDGITAPMFWALLFGAPGLWLYKAVNTCDSMVGYKNEEFRAFGFASAKFDDILNYVPSRITGFLIVVLTRNDSGMPLKKRLSIWLRDAPKHPSPNSGWLEAATAVQLGVELGGVNSYSGVRLIRAKMGEPLVELEVQHIRRAVHQMHVATVSFFVLIAIGGMLFEIA